MPTNMVNTSKARSFDGRYDFMRVTTGSMSVYQCSNEYAFIVRAPYAS